MCKSSAITLVSQRIPLIHERLRELRKDRRLSQDALARLATGVSVDTIRKYESSARAGSVPDVEILEALAFALEVNPAEAFYEWPIAVARRAARPGASQRRKPAKPTPADVAEAAAERIEAPHPATAPTRRRPPPRAREV